MGAYHQLWQIEKSFRMSKTDLRARPIYHHKRDSIEAHLTIVFAALAVTRWLERTRPQTLILKLPRDFLPWATVCTYFYPLERVGTRTAAALRVAAAEGAHPAASATGTRLVPGGRLVRATVKLAGTRVNGRDLVPTPSAGHSG